MLNLWNVPSEILPEIKSSNDTFGICEIPILGKSSIPVTGVLGDQHASIFGQACFIKGQTKCTYGTGAFILTNTGDSPVTSTNGLLSTIAWSINKQTTYALEGSVFSAGSAVQWLRDEMSFFDEANEIEKLALIPTQIVGPREHQPRIGIVQDTLLGSNRFTKYDVYLTEKEVLDLVQWIENFNGIAKVNIIC